MDRDELVGELPEHRHGGAPPADGRTAAALGRDGAGQDEFAVLDGAAGVVDALGDGVVVRDVPAAPRPRRSTHRGGPSSRRRARRAGGRARVTIIVLPAPVSPVTTVKPGPSSSVVSPITPRSEIAISSITARPRRPAGGPRHPATRELELRDQPVGERGVLQPRDPHRGPSDRRTSTAQRPAAGRASGGRRTTARRRRCVPPRGTSIASARSGPTTIGRANRAWALKRHHEQGVDVRPDDRAAAGERVRRGPGRRGHDDTVAPER